MSKRYYLDDGRANMFSFFDPFYDLFEHNVSKKNHNFLRSDVVEENDHYEIVIDVPGFKKEEIKVDLNNGYLKVSAVKEESKETEGKNYLRKERYSGAYERMFYLGNRVKEEDIKASLKDGSLHLVVCKHNEAIEKTRKTIAIE